METAQKTREALTVTTFKNAVVSAEGSKTFLKKLLPTAVSYILHQRIDFDKKDFLAFTHNGSNYTIFKTKVTNGTLGEIKKWLNGALDALSKNYLRELYLIFSNEDEPDHILESYKFQFRYFGEDAYMLDPVTKEQLVKSTSLLLEAIDSLKLQNPLNHNKTEIKMALTYYQDVTPVDYHPPHFGTDETDGMPLLDAISNHSSSYYSLGNLKTGFHGVKCRAKGDAFALDKSFSSVPDLEEGFRMTEDLTDKGSDVHEIIDENDSTNIESTTNAVSQINFTEESQMARVDYEPSVLHDITNLSDDIEMVEETSSYFINCSCNISTKFDKIDLVECSKCSTFQHAVCSSYLNAADVPKPYICPSCRTPVLTPLASKSREKGSICRLVMAIIHFTEEYRTDIFKNVSESMKELVIRTLLKNEILKTVRGKTLPNLPLIRSRLLAEVFKKSKPLPESIELDNDDEEPLKFDDTVQEPKRKKGKKSRN